QRVLSRDRRRMWILGTLCVIAWMMVVMLPWATVMPAIAQIVKLQRHAPSAAPALAATRPHAPPPLTEQDQSQHIARVLKFATIVTFIGSVSTMFVAALCTVLLVTLSRRATLRQVNARLIEISDQLKLLATKP
ncbi:MAG TPA: hypothetical protein VF669_20710, partial [Tepidisphaeraceae bacterium]